MNTETIAIYDRWKAEALTARDAAQAADDGVAQRAAEQDYNEAVAAEQAERLRERKAAAVKARIKAEETAEREGYAAAERGVGPEGSLKAAKSLRAQWDRGWNAYYTRPEAAIA